MKYTTITEALIYFRHSGKSRYVINHAEIKNVSVLYKNIKEQKSSKQVWKKKNDTTDKIYEYEHGYRVIFVS